MIHTVSHRLHRSGGLRASLLGANDGLISTASLLAGVAAADTAQPQLLLIGIASTVAGAISMAAGEYVSVSSQADIERADLAMERTSIDKDPAAETQELVDIYRARGLSESLASEVARQMMQHDPLAAHARDDIGILDHTRANPMGAALLSGLWFCLGALCPLICVGLVAPQHMYLAVMLVPMLCLPALGAGAAYAGGAPLFSGALRVTVWGAAAMLLTSLVGHLFGVSM